MGASLHREPSMNPGRARPYQTATSYLTVHAPALTSCVLLEGCCSRSASAAVSMAHVTFARVSAVCGRRAGGTALGGRSSDCAVSCCIATLMRSWKAVSKPLDSSALFSSPTAACASLPRRKKSRNDEAWLRGANRGVGRSHPPLFLTLDRIVWTILRETACSPPSAPCACVLLGARCACVPPLQPPINESVASAF